MTLTDQVLTAFRNMGRRKMRSFLASLGVVVGTVTIVLLVSLASGVRQHINQQFESVGLDRLTVYPPGKSPFRGRGPLSLFRNLIGEKKIIAQADLERWREWPGVTKVTPRISLPNSVELELKWQDKTQPVRMGELPMRPGQMIWAVPAEPVAGTLELPEQGGIVLSQGTTRAMDIADEKLAELVGQHVEVILRTSRGENQNYDLVVQGVASDMSVTIQLTIADCLALKSWWFNNDKLLETEGYDSVMVNCADVSRAMELIKRFHKEGYEVQSLEVFVEVANRIVIIATIMLVMIGGVALLVASIGIANTMIMAVYERTREIGVLKALGASGGDIQRLVMIESGFIGLIGGVLGLLGGWAAGALLNQGILWYLHHRDLPMRGVFFLVTPLLALCVIGFAAFIGITAGWLPARRASNLDPLEALRHE